MKWAPGLLLFLRACRITFVLGANHRESPCGSAGGMFPQAHNPPRKRGTRAYAVVRQALWSHPVQRRISDGSTTAQRRISDGSTTAQRRISDGSTTAPRRISDGSTTAPRRIRACKPRNPADERYEQSYRRRNCRRLGYTGGRVHYGGGDVAAPRLQETIRKRNLPVTGAAVITDLPPSGSRSTIQL